MKIRQYQVDAFAERVFEGNPAAVCPLEGWPQDELLQRIAEENSLPETAFFVPAEKGYQLRWFTPAAEVDLCGHATLAAAHIIFETGGCEGGEISFETRSGALKVVSDGRQLSLDLPASPPEPCPAPQALMEGLGRKPAEVLAAQDYLAVFDAEEVIRAVSPDFSSLAGLDRRGVIITSLSTPGQPYDLVCRFFAPKLGIPEDPVTGSAQCQLMPYWAARLGRDELSSRQLSRRGGSVRARLSGSRVILSGSAVTFMVAEIETGT